MAKFGEYGRDSRQPRRADDGTFANFHAAENRGIAPDRGPAANQRRLARPILAALQAAVVIRRARKPVVREHHAMADERLILDRDARADERVALDLHAPADFYVRLDLHKGPDERLVADLAAIEIGEADDADVLPEFDTRGDAQGRFTHDA
jgi:hypothetical protein